MAERLTVHINGHAVEVPPGTSVAAAIALAEATGFRRSVTGQPRAPLCGMGVCFECRVTLQGQPHQLSCMTPCVAGLEVRTDD